MRKQLLISIATVLSVLLLVSETPAGKGIGDLSQIPDRVYKEIEIGSKKLCFVTNVRQCLVRVTCDENRRPVPAESFTLADFLGLESAKITVESQECPTFTIDIKRKENPCVFSGGRMYC
jgi:hypothetical protein